MSPVVPWLRNAAGRALTAPTDGHFARLCCVAFVGGAYALTAVPGQADEHILAADNGEVRCQASKSDLTRIALTDDQFAAVSRVQTGSAQEDFAIVHEPTRGDIYLSVPEGYAKPKIAFFGTTRRGFVYKFDCHVAGEAALQVFVTNVDLESPQAAPPDLQTMVVLDDRAVALVRAMFEQRSIAGFEIRDAARAPVNVGDLKVQLVSEYRSPAMTGKVLRIENKGAASMTLQEELIAGDGVIAVSISNRNLARGQATAAYVVVPSGE